MHSLTNKPKVCTGFLLLAALLVYMQEVKEYIPYMCQPTDHIYWLYEDAKSSDSAVEKHPSPFHITCAFIAQVACDWLTMHITTN